MQIQEQTKPMFYMGLENSVQHTVGVQILLNEYIPVPEQRDIKCTTAFPDLLKGN